MRNRNIKFGTYEYGRLSDEGKLMVIKNQISNLIDNNSGRTVGIMYNGKLRRVPFDNQKEISSMIEVAKALKKKCKTNIEIFDDSKEFTMTFIDSSNRRVIENYNVNETGNEIIIDIPKTENKSKEIKYTEDKYNLVFKDFFKLNVDAKVSKDDYKIVLDDSLDEKQKESYDVFDLDLDSFFEMKAPSEEYELTDEKLTYKIEEYEDKRIKYVKVCKNF